MVLAGLWETWRSSASERVLSFTIITTTPTRSVRNCTIGCPSLFNRGRFGKGVSRREARCLLGQQWGGKRSFPDATANGKVAP